MNYNNYSPDKGRNHQKFTIQGGFTPRGGFTLIELLISMVIIMLIGSVIFTIFSSTLRGTDRAQSLITIRQKGNYALSQMVKSIRFAENISNLTACSGKASSELQIISSTDHEMTTYRCEDSSIASKSASKTYFLLETNSNITLKSCSFTCGVQQPYYTPYVTISFSLIPTAKKESTSPDVLQDFHTTVFLRNTIE